MWLLPYNGGRVSSLQNRYMVRDNLRAYDAGHAELVFDLVGSRAKSAGALRPLYVLQTGLAFQQAHPRLPPTFRLAELQHGFTKSEWAFGAKPTPDASAAVDALAAWANRVFGLASDLGHGDIGTMTCAQKTGCSGATLFYTRRPELSAAGFEAERSHGYPVHTGMVWRVELPLLLDQDAELTKKLPVFAKNSNYARVVFERECSELETITPLAVRAEVVLPASRGSSQPLPAPSPCASASTWSVRVGMDEKRRSHYGWVVGPKTKRPKDFYYSNLLRRIDSGLPNEKKQAILAELEEKKQNVIAELVEFSKIISTSFDNVGHEAKFRAALEQQENWDAVLARRLHDLQVPISDELNLVKLWAFVLPRMQAARQVTRDQLVAFLKACEDWRGTKGDFYFINRVIKFKLFHSQGPRVYCFTHRDEDHWEEWHKKVSGKIRFPIYSDNNCPPVSR